MKATNQTTLGELIAMFFDEFMDAYDDEEVAAAGTAVILERLINGVYV